MIKVIFTGNAGSEQELFPADATIRQAFDHFGVNYGGRQLFIDGSPIRVGDMDKSFESLGITTYCTLSAIEQKNNA